MAPSRSKRRHLFALGIVLGIALIVLVGGGGAFIIHRVAGHGHRVQAGRAGVAMPMVQAYQLANGRWPSKPTDLVPAFMSPKGAAMLERDGFTFVTESDGSFVIKWEYRGVARTINTNLQFSPPLP
jgi:hypothetical protein